MNTPPVSPDLASAAYFEPVRRRARLVASIVGVAMILGVAATFVTPTRYAARASILVSPISADPSETVVAGIGVVDIETEIRLATSRAVADIAAAELIDTSIGDVDTILAAVSASSGKSSKVLDIRFVADDPQLASQGTQAVADAYLAYRFTLVNDQIDTAKSSLQTRITELQFVLSDLNEQIATLDSSNPARSVATSELQLVLSELSSQQQAFAQLSTVLPDPGELIDPATPPSAPSSLGRLPIIAGATVAGLIAALALAYLLDAMAVGRRARATVHPHESVEPEVRHPDPTPQAHQSAEPEVRYPNPTLHSPANDGGVGRVGEQRLEDVAALVAQRCADRPVTVGIVDLGDAPRGATAALGLARRLGGSGTRCVVIDGDVGEPTAHQRVGLELVPGLAETLNGQLAASETLRTVEPGVSVLTTGSATPTTPGDLAGDGFRFLLSELRALHNAVLIVSGRLGTPGARRLANASEAIVLVAGGRPLGADDERELAELAVPVLGIVTLSDRSRSDVIADPTSDLPRPADVFNTAALSGDPGRTRP